MCWIFLILNIFLTRIVSTFLCFKSVTLMVDKTQPKLNYHSWKNWKIKGKNLDYNRYVIYVRFLLGSKFALLYSWSLTSTSKTKQTKKLALNFVWFWSSGAHFGIKQWIILLNDWGGIFCYWMKLHYKKINHMQILNVLLFLYRSDSAYFDGLDETILCAGLVKAKPGLFNHWSNKNNAFILQRVCLAILTLYTLTSVCIFSKLFSLHFPMCWQE